MGSPDFALAPRPWPERPGRSTLAGARAVLLSGRATALPWTAALREAGCELEVFQETTGFEAALAGAPSVVLVSIERLTDALASVQALGEPPPLVLLGDRRGAPREGRDENALVYASLPEPVDPDLLLVTVGRALEHRALQRENRDLRASLSERFAIGNVVTRDAQMRAILETVETIADSRASVLLMGESGTGKTMLAQAIHQRSSRAAGPFVVVNCGALPGTLLESELFGHVRGAFTGAVKDKTGRFELAHGGTIFLDEINSASADLQVKLLRVVQERKLERVGDSTTREVDVRLVTATNVDLVSEIEAGRFREDLYYRINVVSLELPPLRERPGDIVLLAEHFLGRYAREYGKGVTALDPPSISALVAHPWPGNVRQLENTIERAVLLSATDVLRPVDLGPDFERPVEHSGGDLRGTLSLGLEQLESLPSLKRALEGPEREIIRRALEIHGGNRTRTAEMLDVNRTTLFNKMKKYGLMSLTFEPRYDRRGRPGRPAGDLPDRT